MEKASLFERLMLLFSFILAILVVIAYSIPAISLSLNGQDIATTVYFFSGSSGDASAPTFDLFASVLVCILAIISPFITAIAKKESVKFVGLGMLLASCAWAFAINGYTAPLLSELQDSLGSNGNLSTPAVTLLLVESILAILFALALLVHDYFGEFLSKQFHLLMQANKNGADTLEKKLANLKKLKEEGYITEEEYESKRKAIIDEIK